MRSARASHVVFRALAENPKRTATKGSIRYARYFRLFFGTDPLLNAL